MNDRKVLKDKLQTNTCTHRKECKVCGKEFIGFARSSLCSDACRELASREVTARKSEKLKLRTKLRSERESTCVVCDKKFITKHNTKMTCSGVCSLEHRRARDIQSYNSNKEYTFVKSAERRAKQRQAIPSWYDSKEVTYIYKLSRERGLVVDHIVPLVSDRVCGLHVQDNLRCIPQKLNAFKQNRYWPDMAKQERVYA